MADPTPRPVPTTPEEEYPPFVIGGADRRRWDVARAMAEEMYGGPGQEEVVWQATRTIYQSPART